MCCSDGTASNLKRKGVGTGRIVESEPMPDPFSKSRVSKVDSRNVKKAYDDWPRLAREGFRVKVELPGKPANKLYVLGMGGSAAGGDVIDGWLSGRPGIEVAVFKGGLPVADLSDGITIACSASGQTEETVDMLRTAVSRKARVVSISGGGRLKEVSEELGVPHIRLPAFIAPRYAFPYILFSNLAVANKGLALGCEGEAEDAFGTMDAEREDTGLETPAPRNGAKVLAAAILDRVPAIYGARVVWGAGVRFKNILNENAKKHALFDGVPDAFHNDIEAWEGPSDDFVPVFLRHTAESERDRANEDEMVGILESSERHPIQIRGRGESSLAQLVSMVYRLDLTSYYAAIGLGRDPFPTRFIDRLKSNR